MPLQGQTVDVLFQPLNQQSPVTGGPVGRLRGLTNAIVKKIAKGDRTGLRVEKRDGFAALVTGVRDPATGASSPKTLTKPGLLTTYRDQLIGVWNAAPYVLSETESCWYSPTYTSPTQVLRARAVSAPNVLPAGTDSARIGARTLTVMLDATGTPAVHVSIKDDDGTVMFQEQIVFQTGSAPVNSAKVLAVNGRFWLVIACGGLNQIRVSTCDDSGNGITTFDTSVTLTANSYVDVAPDQTGANRIFVAQKISVGAGITLHRYSFSGSISVSSATCNFALCSTGRLAFMQNDTGDGNLYLGTIDGAGPFSHYVWQITTPAGTPANGHQYTVTPAPIAKAAFQMTGFIAPTGNKDLTIISSFLDTTPAPQLNYSEIKTVTFAGVTTLVRTQTSITAVSRAFAMAGQYYVVCYYRSNPAGFTAVAQSTYFLVNLAAPWQVCGRWDWGTAYADWADTATTTFYLALATVNTDAAGGLHWILPYRISSQTAIALVGDVFTPVKHTVDVVGLKEYTLGPDFGQAVDLGGTLLMPGPRATTYDGNFFADDGQALLFEVPTTPTQAVGGSLTVLGKYQYIIVAEDTDASGNRIRGPAGPPIDVTLTGGNNQITLTGYNIHPTQRGSLISVYRTVIQNGVQSAQHFKVSGTLVGNAFGGPVVINTDTATWTFVDQMSDANAALGEPLYTDAGQLDRHPAPPFSVGCRAFNRAFVVGYDNAVWFSGEKTEGDAYWFSPAQRIIMPTSERVTEIKQMDSFLLVFCTSSVYSIPGGPFPDATGAGGSPTPVLLPFTNGCTGFAELTSDGVMYSSSQGGIWIITRDLRNLYIGAAVEDTTSTGIVGSASDDKQRTMFVTAGGIFAVYDQVTGVWATWSSNGFDTTNATNVVTTHKGRFALHANGGTAVVQQALGTYVDPGATPIITSVNVAFMRLGGIRNYKRLWNCQIQGERLGDCDMTATMYQDDNDVTPTAFFPWTPGISKTMVKELPPKVELCDSVSLLFSDAFPRGATQGCALEVIAFYLGLESGLARRPATDRVKST